MPQTALRLLQDKRSVQSSCRDPRIWDYPAEFRPERFRTWNKSAYNFIAQGAGDFSTGHRCPGEQSTIAIMKRIIRSLAKSLEYELPRQDLRVDMSRLPAIPKSRVIVANVKVTE